VEGSHLLSVSPYSPQGGAELNINAHPKLDERLVTPRLVEKHLADWHLVDAHTALKDFCLTINCSRGYVGQTLSRTNSVVGQMPVGQLFFDQNPRSKTTVFLLPSIEALKIDKGRRYFFCRNCCKNLVFFSSQMLRTNKPQIFIQV